jgi:hypothetical protein
MRLRQEDHEFEASLGLNSEIISKNKSSMNNKTVKIKKIKTNLVCECGSEAPHIAYR